MNKKITIIGGGIAGLSTGIYGQMNGFHTEIIEMHKRPGGQCTAWERKGFRFDYCLHWLVGTKNGMYKDMWKDTNVLNNDTRIVDHEIFGQMINEKEEEFTIYTNIDRWEQYLLEMAPEDKKAIRRMCRHMRKGRSFAPFIPVRKMKDAATNVSTFFSMLPVYLLFVRFGKKDCAAYFKKLGFKNPKLTWFLHNTYGKLNFAAIAFILMLGWFDQKNAGYIIGGSQALIDRMKDRYQALGGKLTTGKKAKRIMVENNTAKGVELADGTIINSEYVISAADGHSTIFNMLGGKYLSRQHRDAYDNWEVFTPIVQVSFGVDAVINQEAPAAMYLAEDKMIGSTKLKSGYTIMNYAFDPTMAPKGKSVIVLRFESPWKIWEHMDENTYKEEKEKIRKEALSILEYHYPVVTGKIMVTDIATPRTGVRYTGVWKASYEGFMPSKENITKTLKNTLPGLDNFYLAGQWLYPGGGLPPSADSGRKAIRMICKKEKKPFLHYSN